MNSERDKQRPGKPLKVFISYAHEDEKLKDTLERHLSAMRRQGLIEIWHDREVTAGTEWGPDIDSHLESSDIILLLVSPDFIASDYCYGTELQAALQRYSKGEALVIPVVVRAVDWGDAPFARLQACPTDAKPVTSWANQDEAFHNVALGIRTAVENWSPGTRPPRQATPPSTSFIAPKEQIEWIVIVDVDLSAFDERRIAQLVGLLRDAGRDPHLSFVRLERGSVRLHFRSTLAAYKKISSLANDNSLTDLFGANVLSVVPYPERSLVDFPRYFSPVDVVVGDIREMPPRTAGDCFARATSATELRFLPSLGLPRDSVIISDKIFMSEEIQALRHRFGHRNLLVVGSPASNLLFRLLNKHSPFRFHTSEEAEDLLKTVQNGLKSVGNDVAELGRFTLEEQSQRAAKLIIRALYRDGLVDLTQPDWHRGAFQGPHSDTDFGLVAICPNPFAEDDPRYVAILAGGQHLPATTAALRLLSEPSQFRDRPFGGVFEVRLNEFTRRAERLDTSCCTWQTPPYNGHDFARRLEACSGKVDGVSSGSEATRQYLEFIRGLIGTL